MAFRYSALVASLWALTAFRAAATSLVFCGEEGPVVEVLGVPEGSVDVASGVEGAGDEVSLCFSGRETLASSSLLS